MCLKIFVWTCVFRIGGICSICSLLMLNCIPTYIWLKFFMYLIWVNWISLLWFCYNLFKINNALIGAYKIGTTLILWFILKLYFPLQNIFYLGISYLLEKKITKKCHNGILLPKLFGHTVRKNCSSDREKLLKFEAEGREFAKFLRSLEQFIQTVKGQNNFW